MTSHDVSGVFASFQIAECTGDAFVRCFERVLATAAVRFGGWYLCLPQRETEPLYQVAWTETHMLDMEGELESKARVVALEYKIRTPPLSQI